MDGRPSLLREPSDRTDSHRKRVQGARVTSADIARPGQGVRSARPGFGVHRSVVSATLQRRRRTGYVRRRTLLWSWGCCVSGHRGRMSRVMEDTSLVGVQSPADQRSGACNRLVPESEAPHHGPYRAPGNALTRSERDIGWATRSASPDIGRLVGRESLRRSWCGTRGVRRAQRPRLPRRVSYAVDVSGRLVGGHQESRTIGP